MSALAHVLHLTIPHRSNNYRARLLQPLGLFTLLLAYLLGQSALRLYSASRPGVLGYAANISVDRVISLTNEKRTSSGLAALRTNSILNSAAAAKGKHMLEHDYWAHVAPDGTEPWAFFIDYGYKYRYAGENLARDFSNPQAAVDAWMASPSHRDNLMSPKYTEIGVAVVEGDLNGVDTTIIVQLFGTPMSVAPIAPVAAASAELEEVKEPVVTVSEEDSGEEDVVKLDTSSKAVVSPASPVTSPLEIGKISAAVIITLLFMLLLVDVFVLWQKRLPRNGGRPLAHISFFVLIFAIIVLAKAGSII